MQEIKLNDIADSLIIFNKITFDRLLKSEMPADNIALYTFYYYAAKWQGTNQPKCTTTYVATGLKWSEPRVRKAKKELLDIGLVEDITSKDESGKITGHFVKVNYFSSSTLKENHTVENPQYGTADTVEKLGANALYNNINALDSYNKCLKKNKEIQKDSKNTQNQQVAKPTSSNEDTSALKEYIKCLKTEIEMLKNNNIIEKNKKENFKFDIIEYYNKICVSLPKVKTMSAAREKLIKSIVKKHSIEQIKEVFKKAETSDFLKGKNNSDWQANFDWLMKDSNFAKVLDGNYNKNQKGTEETKSFGNYNKQKFSDRVNSDYE